jgi:hypothetical protein
MGSIIVIKNGQDVCLGVVLETNWGSGLVQGWWHLVLGAK